MNDKELSAEESLKVIQSMISLSREKIKQTGFHFILWGILVAIASLAQYCMVRFEWKAFPSYWVWPLMSIIGGVMAFTYEKRRSRSVRTTSRFDRVYIFLWLGFGITLITTIAISVANQLQPVPFILSITGLAVFISGVLFKFTPLILGAILFWLAAIVCLFLSPLNQLLLNAGVIALGYIIPGILLGKNYVSTT